MLGQVSAKIRWRWRRRRLVSGTTIRASQTSASWGCVLTNGWYEFESDLFFRAVLRPGSCVIDVEANDGVLTVIPATLVGETGAMHAIEPDPTAANIVDTATHRNKLFWDAYQTDLATLPG